jgi:hypothetical protein
MLGWAELLIIGLVAAAILAPLAGMVALVVYVARGIGPKRND